MTSHYARYVKPRLQNDPEFKKNYKEYMSNYYKNKYNTDDEYREKLKEKTRQEHRQRYAEDPEYKQKKIDQAMARYYAKKALKLQTEIQSGI